MSLWGKSQILLVAGLITDSLDYSSCDPRTESLECLDWTLGSIKFFGVWDKTRTLMDMEDELMKTLVITEPKLKFKFLLTNITLIRFLSCMHSHVNC